MMVAVDTSVVRGTLDDATPVVIDVSGRRPPLGVWVNPAAGDTVRVEYRIDSSMPWRSWEKGDVTAYADDVAECPLSHLRFTRIAGTGTTSAYGVR